MRVVASMLVIACAGGLIAAQAPAPGPQAKDKAKEKPKTDKPVKLPPSPLDKVEGYKRQIIEGFTVMVTPEAAEGEIKDAELKPLDALALEFQTMKKAMPPKHVELLQKVTVWIEWDVYEPISNGREGRALATYYGGTPQSLIAAKKDPFKAKCVTVHSLKMLAEEHQPKRDSHRLVMLHEFAHAVHDQLLGFDHAGILTAYKQAMERRLYDKAQYVSTNEKEFFAELSCGYYDQLQHYPKTRDDLKKHDPVTHQLLESIWGTGKKPVKTVAAAPVKPKSLAELNGADKFDLKIALADIKLGATVHGTEFKTDDAKDAVAILSNFGGDELLVLEKLARMHEELSPYGAKVVVAYSFVKDPDAVKKLLEERAVAYTGLDKALYPLKGGQTRSEAPGHTVIFDETGKCVFRGSGYEAMPHARAAVAKMLVAKAIPGTPPKGLVPVVEAMSQGASPILDHLPKIGALMVNADPDTAAAAKALAAAILAPAQAILAEAQTNAKTEPLASFLLAEKIPAAYKGTSTAAKATAMMDQLKLNPIVAKELKARKLFEPIKKIDQHLMAQPGSFSPLDDKFQNPNKAYIAQLVVLNAQLKKAHPLALCTAEAAKITAKYRIGD